MNYESNPLMLLPLLSKPSILSLSWLFCQLSNIYTIPTFTIVTVTEILASTVNVF